VLTPEQIEALAVRLVSGHEEALVTDLLQATIRALVKDGELTVKEMRLLQTAAANLSDDVALIVARYQPHIRRTTLAEVTRLLAESDDGDVEMLSRYYSMPALGGTAQFERIAQETAEGVAQIIARNNLRMASRAEGLWYEVASRAITEANHGTTTLDRIMSRAVTRLSREGLSTIDYASGVKSNIDVAVRRHVMSQVGQAAGRMTMARMQQFGHDLVFVSAHFGARPDHAAWQGRAYSIAGAKPGYPDFYSTTGYGTVTGLLGVNCKHTYGPYFPGITELPEVDATQGGLTSDELYDLTQTQRAYERAIRQTKRDIAALQTGGLDVTDARLKLGRQQAKLREFVGDNDLLRQGAREKAYGIGGQPIALRRAG